MAYRDALLVMKKSFARLKGDITSVDNTLSLKETQAYSELGFHMKGMFWSALLKAFKSRNIL